MQLHPQQPQPSTSTNPLMVQDPRELPLLSENLFAGNYEIKDIDLSVFSEQGSTTPYMHEKKGSRQLH